jgi:hypothetical protein
MPMMLIRGSDCRTIREEPSLTRPEAGASSGSGLLPFEHVLMLPSRDQSFLGGGTVMFDNASPAGVSPVTAQDQPVFFGRVTVCELEIDQAKR